MQTYLIREFQELCEGGYCLDLLTEQEKNNMKSGYVYMTGILQTADTPNGNNRIYNRKILEREIENFEKLVKENRALGELDHPQSEIINLDSVSHIIRRTWWNDKSVYGTIEVLDTPKGKILQELLKRNVKLGISSRGLGSIHERNGHIIVEDDFQLVTFDIVSDPSTPGAFLFPINLTEDRKRNMYSKLDKINRMLNDILRSH